MKNYKFLPELSKRKNGIGNFNFLCMLNLIVECLRVLRVTSNALKADEIES